MKSCATSNFLQLTQQLVDLQYNKTLAILPPQEWYRNKTAKKERDFVIGL
jgi:hypothetical protein